MTVEAPLPSVVTLRVAMERFDLPLVALGELGTASAESFWADF
ncbi:MAG TPA: hypothetical protein VGG70_11905 [Candidatus Cybelea sp.]